MGDALANTARRGLVVYGPRVLRAMVPRKSSGRTWVQNLDQVVREVLGFLGPG